MLAIPLASPHLSVRRAVILAAVGAIGLWFSHPLIFLLAGYGSAGLLLACRERDWRTGRTVALLGVVWVLSFAALYRLNLQPTNEDTYLQDYWKGYFAPFPPRSLSDLAWYYRIPMLALADPMGIFEPRPAAVAALIGVVALVWRLPRTGLYLLTPLPFLLAASAIHAYPLSSRLLLFLGPTIALILGLGVMTFAGGFRRYAAVVAVVVSALVIVLPTARAKWGEAVDPHPRREVLPVLQEVRSQWQPGDRVLAYDGWGASLTYYADRLGFAPDARGERDGTPAIVPTGGRLWVVLDRDREAVVLADLNALGAPTRTLRAAGTTAFEFAQ